MSTELDIHSPDGRTLHVYDTGPDPVLGDPDDAGESTAVFWMHGSPNIGSPPTPLLAAAHANGLHWVSYDRPGYGGSDPQPGRTVASAAADVNSIANHLGLDRFAVLGHSGGGPHALACAALLPTRVIAAVSVSAPAPFDAHGLDWFTGWSPGIAAEHRAACKGRAALQAHWAAAEPEDMSVFFTPGDLAALTGDWSWLANVAGQAMQQDGDGFTEDTLAGVRPWGFQPHAVGVPTLIIHGDQDKMVPPAHGQWLAAQTPTAELQLIPGAGHITALDATPTALTWITPQVHP